MTTDTDNRALTEFVADDDSETGSDATDADELEARIEELEDGVEILADTIEDAIENIDRLADHVEATDTDSTDAEPTDDPTTTGFH